MELSVRPAGVEDYESINQLSNQFGYQGGAEKTRERLSKIIASNENCAFVAIGNGLIIGWIHAFYALRIASEPFVEIGGLVIHEAYRRRGVGSILVQRVAEWTALKNVGAIRVRCNAIRRESHAFYMCTGFKEVKDQKVFTRPV